MSWSVGKVRVYVVELSNRRSSSRVIQLKVSSAGSVVTTPLSSTPSKKMRHMLVPEAFRRILFRFGQCDRDSTWNKLVLPVPEPLLSRFGQRPHADVVKLQLFSMRSTFASTPVPFESPSSVVNAGLKRRWVWNGVPTIRSSSSMASPHIHLARR